MQRRLRLVLEKWRFDIDGKPIPGTYFIVGGRPPKPQKEHPMFNHEELTLIAWMLETATENNPEDADLEVLHDKVLTLLETE